MEPRRLPGTPARLRLVIVRLVFLCETTTRGGSVADCRGHRCKKAHHAKLLFMGREKGGKLLFARVVSSIDIVELQGCASVNLNNDLARGHRVVMHVRVQIGEAAGGK